MQSTVRRMSVESALAFASTAGDRARDLWTRLVDGLRVGFEEQPLLTTLKVIGALVATKIAFGIGREIALQWKIGSAFKSLPRAAGSVPFFGHALRLNVESPWDVMESWIKGFNYQAMALEYFGKTGIVISDLERVRRVFNTRQRNYDKDLELSYDPFLDVLGNGLVTSSGALWNKQRTLLGHALRVEILEETAPVARRAADRLSMKLQEHVENGKPIELAEEFRVLTLQVIGELILTLSPEESAEVFPNLYLPLVEEANLRIWAPWRKYMFWTAEQRAYKKTVAGLNSYLCDLIRRRWGQRLTDLARGAKKANPDILDRIFDDIDPSTWSEATVLQLRDEIKTFIFAGHETSAAMMTWLIYELTQNPDIEAKLLQNASNVLGTGRGAGATRQEQFTNFALPPRTELNNLTYVLNALKETLRLHTLVPVVTRQANEDDDLDGLKVPAGSKVFVHIKAVHHNPAVWDKPETFQPERFEKEHDPCAFLPFIVGPRNCLGQHLALLEARIVIALLSLRFKFEPARADVGESHGRLVPLVPKHGMWLKVKAR
eukprot:m.52670 g.52670  ORF g.52670 m.52670 type:complete len:548 (+) comp12727_c0_seq1:16-1659(+)